MYSSVFPLCACIVLYSAVLYWFHCPCIVVYCSVFLLGAHFVLCCVVCVVLYYMELYRIAFVIFGLVLYCSVCSFVALALCCIVLCGVYIVLLLL